jgi:hypothetical protein
MSTTNDLDSTLRAWLSSGPEHAPTDAVQRAIEDARATAQRRSRTLPLGPRDVPASTRSLIVGLAAAALLVALGLGIGMQTGLIRLPVPAPSILPAPTDRSETEDPTDATEPAPRIAVAPDGTFQVNLPSARWTFDQGPDPSALYLRHGATRISIRAGDEVGRLLTCDDSAGPWENCDSVTATTLEDLAEAVGLTPTAEEGVDPVGPTRSVAVLDGEPAVVEEIEAYEHPARGGEFVTYISAIHENRPFLLRLWTPNNAGLPGEVGLLLENFRFLTMAPVPIEQPESIEGFRTFAARDGSFEIRLPETWRQVAGDDSTALYLENGVNELSIRGGDSSGTVRTCDQSGGSWERCDTITVATLPDLSAGIDLQARGSDFQGPIRSEATLDGEPAMRIQIVTGPSAQTTTYFVAMKDGRPFVLRHTVPGSSAALADILEGFSFLAE